MAPRCSGGPRGLVPRCARSRGARAASLSREPAFLGALELHEPQGWEMAFPLARRCAGDFVRAPPLRGFWSVGCPWGFVCGAARATNAFLACSVTWFTHFCAFITTTWCLITRRKKGAHGKGDYIGHCVGTVSWGKLREKHLCLIICMGMLGKIVNALHLHTFVHSGCILRVCIYIFYYLLNVYIFI